MHASIIALACHLAGAQYGPGAMGPGLGPGSAGMMPGMGMNNMAAMGSMAEMGGVGAMQNPMGQPTGPAQSMQMMAAGIPTGPAQSMQMNPMMAAAQQIANGQAMQQPMDMSPAMGMGMGMDPAAGLSAMATNAVPHFDIDLNQAPEKRWVQVAQAYKPEIIDQIEKVLPKVAQAITDDGGQISPTFLAEVPFDQEYERELQGIAQTVQHPSVTLENLKMLNMIYEMESVRFEPGCSDVLWTTTNGTVMHGRNLDDFSNEAKIINWPGLTFEATLWRGRGRHKRPILKCTQWPGAVGVYTGMRYPDRHGKGYSFAQNTRYPNTWTENLAAAREGGQVYELAARRVLESTSDFQTAVNLLYSTSFMAPQYFSLAGAGPGEGAVLAIDRLAQHSLNTPPVQHLGQGAKDWFLIQTNDDMLAEPLDDRRPAANDMLSRASQAIANENTMAAFMKQQPLFNEGTLYTTVMVPGTGYYKTYLPNDQAPDVSAALMSQGFSLSQRKLVLKPDKERIKKAKEATKASKGFLNQQRPLKPIGHAAPHTPADEVSFMQQWLQFPDERYEV